MNGIQRSIGFNVTTSRLQFVEVEKDSDQLAISNLGQTILSPSLKFEKMSENEILSQLASALDELNLTNKISGSLASFTLPPELFITLQLPYDKNLNQTEITEEFRWELSQLFPYINSDDLAIKYYELRSGFLPGENNALVVALNKKYLLLFKNFCAKVKMTPRLVDNSSIASNLFINNFFSVQNSTVAHLSNSKSSLTVFINISSKPAFVKVFTKSQADLTELFTNKVIVDTFNIMRETNPDYAFISGEGLEADLLSEIQLATSLSFIKYNPFDNIKLMSGISHNEKITENLFSSFVPATGIAARFN